jgi:hypothetical protein
MQITNEELWNITKQIPRLRGGGKKGRRDGTEGRRGRKRR